MGKHPSLFILIVLFFLSSIVLLVATGIHHISQEEFSNFRLQQIKALNIQIDGNIQTVVKHGSLSVSDYFEQTEAGLQYQGGIYDGGWVVGQIYSSLQLTSMDKPKTETHNFLNFPFHDKGFYVNIDRGDETAVREFLTVMDQYGQNGIDTLVLDFRFLQTIDFSSLIRLFNQLAPQQRITFGTIISDHQETEIKSSGKPFFSVERTIFLVDSYMPPPVKLMLRRFGEMSSYELRGHFDMVADTICLDTDYTIGVNTFRVCTDQLTSEEMDEEPFTPISTVTDSTMLEMLAEVDRMWYKKRDTSSVEKYLLSSFSTLLP